MKLAIIKHGASQYTVTEKAQFESTSADPKAVEVLMYSDDKTTKVGSPSLSEISVVLEKIDEKKVKTIVARYKSKSRYDKKNGHKQPIYVFEVKSIGTKTEKKTEAKAETKSKTKVATKSKKAEVSEE